MSLVNIASDCSDVFPLSELGFSSKFSQWREGQFEILMNALDCTTRFDGHDPGPGFGKTASYVGYAKLTGQRALILTNFKGLQEQLTRDWPDIIDIRGKANYWCDGQRMNCEHASPRCEARNSLLGNALCTHKAALVAAQQAQIVVTNYSCWLHAMKTQGFGKFDILIMDEADQALGVLEDFLAFTLNAQEVLRDLRFVTPPHWNDDLAKWVSWAAAVLPKLKELYKDADNIAKRVGDHESLQQAAYLRELTSKITSLSAIIPDDWVCEPQRDGLRFDPIWPGKFAEAHLFRGIPRVSLFSGTLNRKTFELLNVPPEDYTFFEYESPFHPALSPLTLIPVGNMSHKSMQKEPGLMAEVIHTFDRMMDARLNRKALLHTISFKHLEQFMNISRHSRNVISNDVKYSGGSRRTADVVETFKAASPPCILASPSLGIGWDFPDDKCRFQALLKVPWPDTQSAVAKKRRELDPEYFDQIAANNIQQACGRIIRSNRDWGETVCFDTRLSWFLAAKKHLFTKSFRGRPGAYRYRVMNRGVLPKPMNY